MRKKTDHPPRREALKHFFRHGLLDSDLGSVLGILLSSVINFLNGAVHLLAGAVLGAAWPRALGWYYLLLGLIRLIVALLGASPRRSSLSRWRLCRFAARSLRMLDFIMLVMTLIIVFGDGGYRYPGYLLYWVAVLTGLRLLMSVSTLLKGHRETSPLNMAVGTLNTTAALMGLLSLTTAITERIFTAESMGRLLINLIAGLAASGLSLLLADRTARTAVRRIEALTASRERKPFRFHLPFARKK